MTPGDTATDGAIKIPMKIFIRSLGFLGVAVSLGALWLWGSPINLIALIFSIGSWGMAEVQLYALRLNEPETQENNPL